MRRGSIVCIVEGDGEVEAIPILLRRIVRAIDPVLPVPHIPVPIQIKRNRVVKPGGLESSVETAARKAAVNGAILILLDADKDCPATLAPQLLQRARAARSDRPIAVVLAQREYEAWFLAAAESLRGVQGLATTLQPPSDPEAVSGAKEWLRKNMTPNRKYAPIVDQQALTRVFDLDAARTTSSFDKLWRDIERLLSKMNALSLSE